MAAAVPTALGVSALSLVGVHLIAVHCGPIKLGIARGFLVAFGVVLGVDVVVYQLFRYATLIPPEETRYGVANTDDRDH